MFHTMNYEFDKEKIEKFEESFKHENDHMHSVRHHHSEEETRAVINRLSRAIGHLESIKTMIRDGRDCSEILIQLSAVKSAVNNAGIALLQEHIRHCVVDAVKDGDMEILDDLNRALGRYVK